MANVVLKGARIKCTMCDGYSRLIVTDPHAEGFIEANIKDNQSVLNIPFFGCCNSMKNPSVEYATERNAGVLAPIICVPKIVDPWKNVTEPEKKVRGEDALMSDATLECSWDGIIEIKEEEPKPGPKPEKKKLPTPTDDTINEILLITPDYAPKTSKKYFVLDGARILCNKGDMESKLKVTDPGGEGYIAGELAANIEDRYPIFNISPFGQCHSMQNPVVQAATAANYGKLQPMPCVPVIVDTWENETDPKIYIRGEEALLNDAKLQCIYNGKIDVTEEYTGPGTGGEEVLADETYFGEDPDRGPGTQYINIYGHLLYQRRDGASGRVFIIDGINSDRLYVANYGLNFKEQHELEVQLKRAKEESRINDPDNKNLLIGMTPNQYSCQYERYQRIWFYDGYKLGWSGDKEAIKKRSDYLERERKNNYGAEAVTGGFYDSGTAVDIINDEIIGISEGEADRKHGFIHRYNPIARIIPPALLTI